MYKKYKNWLRWGEGNDEKKQGEKRQYYAASLLNQIKWCKNTHTQSISFPLNFSLNYMPSQVCVIAEY